MKRFFDIILALIILIPMFIVMLFIAIVICITSKGPLLYWSDRVGINNTIFRMPKFRSMKITTPEHYSPFTFTFPVTGQFLRRN